MKIRRRRETEEQRTERQRGKQLAREQAAHIEQARRTWRETQKAEQQRQRAQRKAAHQPAPVSGVLTSARHAAVTAIAVIVAAATAASLTESYRGLFDWAREHGLSGLWAAGWPLQVDSFIVTGELALFVALADQWRTRHRLGAWAVTLAGLAVSVAGNIGHVHGHMLSDRLTAAVPPLAAAAALAVGLGVLKRIVATRPAAAIRTPAKRTPAPKTRTHKADTAVAVTADPDTPTGELAQRLGVSTRTVRRHRARVNGS